MTINTEKTHLGTFTTPDGVSFEVTTRGYSYDSRNQIYPRVYLPFTGNGAIEHLFERMGKPATTRRVNAWMRQNVIPALLSKLAVPKTTKVPWSQYAGCSCGCSSGFVIRHSVPGVANVILSYKETGWGP